jgi:hypothetical protein
VPFGFKLDRRSTALVYYPEYPDQTYELLEGASPQLSESVRDVRGVSSRLKEFNEADPDRPRSGLSPCRLWPFNTDMEVLVTTVSEAERWNTLMSAADRGNEEEVAAVLADGDCHLYRKTKVSPSIFFDFFSRAPRRVVIPLQKDSHRRAPSFYTPPSWWCPTAILHRESVVQTVAPLVGWLVWAHHVCSLSACQD